MALYTLSIVPVPPPPELPIVTPGAGWSGDTPDPSPEGTSTNLYYKEKAIALWDMVPSQKFVGSINLWVCAFHGANAGTLGINRVEVSVDNGTWVEMVRVVNPDTGKYEWGATLETSATTGTLTPRFRAYPTHGQARVMQTLCYDGSAHGVLYPRASAAVTETIYCSQTGSNVTGDGTYGNPYGANLDTALDEVLDGGEIVLKDVGIYTVGTNRTPRTNTYWITVRGDSANARTDYRIQVSGGIGVGLDPKFTKLKWQHVRFDRDTFSEYVPREGNLVWFHDVWDTYNDWFLEIPGQLFPFINDYATKAHLYITDSKSYDSLYGFLGADLVRNCAIEKCSAQALTWSRLVINTTVKTFDVAGQDVTVTDDGAGKMLVTYATDNLGTAPKAVLFSAGVTNPTGLTAGTTYYVKRQSATTAKIATSYANANAGTWINYTDGGTGQVRMELSYHGDMFHTFGPGSAPGANSTVIENYIAYGVTTLTGCAEQTLLRITADWWPGIKDFAFVDCDFSTMAQIPPGNFGGPPYSEWVAYPNGTVSGTNGDLSGTTLTLNETKDFSGLTHGENLVCINSGTGGGGDRTWFTITAFNPSAAACTSLTLSETATASRTARTWKVGGGWMRHILLNNVDMPTQRLQFYALADGGGLNRCIAVHNVGLHYAQYSAYVDTPSVYPEGVEFRSCYESNP